MKGKGKIKTFTRNSYDTAGKGSDFGLEAKCTRNAVHIFKNVDFS